MNIDSYKPNMLFFEYNNCIKQHWPLHCQSIALESPFCFACKKEMRIAAITQAYCGDIYAVVLGWDALTQNNFTFWEDDPVLAMAWAHDSKRIVTSTVVSEQATEHLNVQPPDGYFAQISVT